MQNNLYFLCAEENLLRKIRYVITEKKQWERHMHERTGRNAGVRVRVYIAPIARIISSVFVMFHTQKHTYLWYNIGDGIFIESRARQPSSFGHEQRQRWWKDSVSRPPSTKKYYFFVRLSFADRPGVRCSIHRSNNIATTHTGNRFMHAYIMRHNLYSRVSFLSLRTKWL